MCRPIILIRCCRPLRWTLPSRRRRPVSMPSTCRMWATISRSTMVSTSSIFVSRRPIRTNRSMALLPPTTPTTRLSATASTRAVARSSPSRVSSNMASSPCLKSCNSRRSWALRRCVVLWKSSLPAISTRAKDLASKATSISFRFVLSSIPSKCWTKTLLPFLTNSACCALTTLWVTASLKTWSMLSMSRPTTTSPLPTIPPLPTR